MTYASKSAQSDGHHIVFCPQCGAQNAAEEPVCTECGARLYNMQNQPFSPPIQDITRLPERVRDDIRRCQMAFVFQSVALMSGMTAYENVEFGLIRRTLKFQGRPRIVFE